MQYQDLNKLKYLNRDVARLQHRIEELQAFGEGTTSKITGMPSGACRSDKVASAATSLADLEALLKVKLAEVQGELYTLSAFIESIDDPLTRQVFEYTYISGFKSEEIAEHIGGGNTAGSVRVIRHRYLKKMKEAG